MGAESGWIWENSGIPAFNAGAGWSYTPTISFHRSPMFRNLFILLDGYEETPYDFNNRKAWFTRAYTT